MFRKLSLLVLVLAFVAGVMSVSAAPNPEAAGCYVDAPTNVSEGVVFTATVKCNDFINVYGVQFGTTRDGDATANAASFTDNVDTFRSVATSPIDGSNTLDLYGVSRTGNDVATGDFTLGSFTATAHTNLTAGGSYTIDMPSALFKVSNNLGAPISNLLQSDPTAVVNIKNIDLAWLSGTATVRSDSNAIGNVKNVDLNLGGKDYPAAAIASGYQTEFLMSSSYLYIEDASGDVITNGTLAANAPDAAIGNGTLNIAVTADMWGHMACSTSAVNLGDTGAPELVTGITGIGTSGVITLKAGDVDGLNGISNTDATIIAARFGDSDGTINAGGYERDINLDDKVDIYDLVNVGRNFNATAGNCS